MRLLLVTAFPPCRTSAHGGGVYLSSLVDGLHGHAQLGLATLATAQQLAEAGTGSGPWQWFGAAARSERPTGIARVGHQLRMLWRWRHSPLVAAKHHSRAFQDVLRRAVAEWHPDAALVEMAQMAQFLPFLRDVPTVFTDHEAGCPANTTTGLGALADQRDRRLWARYVRHYYPQANLLQAVTPEDAQVLQDMLGRKVAVRPPSVPMPEKPTNPALAPPRALFLGDYSHQPNPEAVARLVHDVVPRIRQRRPDFELWIAGPHCERILSLATAPGVKIAGFAADLGALFGEVRMVLTPVFSGSGVRMKSLVAMAHGLPVVTNALGARGCAAPETARQVAETADDLATASLIWLDSPARAAAAGKAAFEWARDHLAPSAVAAGQLARITDLLQTRRG